MCGTCMLHLYMPVFDVHIICVYVYIICMCVYIAYVDVCVCVCVCAVERVVNKMPVGKGVDPSLIFGPRGGDLASHLDPLLAVQPTWHGTACPSGPSLRHWVGGWTDR